MSFQAAGRVCLAHTSPTIGLRGRIFRHPEPPAHRTRVWPVFVTFQGCPGRCVFCAQHLQSGQAPAPLERVLGEMVCGIEAAGEKGRGPYELAFYGGVFTALPEPWPWRFLAAAARLKAAGFVTRLRCSTRPDACAPDLLSRLADAGLDMVELGAQSFENAVLTDAGRGHDAASIRAAGRAVHRAGLALGLQLLPGLPGHTPEHFARDVAETIALEPEIVRLHPCLVVAGTPLARLYRAGTYAPWDLGTTMEALAQALPALWRGGIRVARIGLCPEPAFAAAVLAGPVHPALGARVRARALLAMLTAASRDMGGRLSGLAAPRRFAGEFFGHAGELAPAYAALGLSRQRVRFEAREDFFLEPWGV